MITQNLVQTSGSPSAPATPVPLSVPKAILRVVLESTAVATLRSPWNSLPPSPLVRELRISAKELIDVLASNFSTTELEESGLVYAKNNQPHLSRVFGDGGNGCRLVIPADAASVAGIFSERGVIGRKNTFSQFAAAKLTSPHAELPIFVATSADCEILQTLGMCTALIDNLRYCRSRHIYDRHAHFKYRFILVGWDLATLSGNPSEKIRRALEYLWALENFYGVDVARRFSVWAPDADAIAKFADGTRCADSDALQNLVETSSHTQRFSPIDFLQRLNDAGDVDLATARIELIKALGECEPDRGRVEVQRASKRYARAFERTVIQPNYAAAAQATGGFDVMLHLQAARLAESLLAEDKLLRAAEDIQRSRMPDVNWQFEERAWDEFTRTLDALSRLKRALK